MRFLMILAVVTAGLMFSTPAHAGERPSYRTPVRCLLFGPGVYRTPIRDFLFGPKQPRCSSCQR